MNMMRNNNDINNVINMEKNNVVITYKGEKMNMSYAVNFGLKDFRANISEVFNSVIYENKQVTIRNARKGGQTATLISTNTLLDILNVYKFDTEISYDDKTNQWEIITSNIQASACGDTKDEAIEMFLDNVIDLTVEYFDNIDLYLKIENTKEQYPYYLKLMNSLEDKNNLLEVLNLK